MKRSSVTKPISAREVFPAPEDEESPGDEGAEMEAEGQPSADQLPAEERAPTSEEDVQALHADLDEAVDQVEALDADGESQESRGVV